MSSCQPKANTVPKKFYSQSR